MTGAPLQTPGRALRLMLVIDGFYPHAGGTESQVTLLCKLFRSRGHDVRIVAPHLDETRPVEELIEGVPVTRLTYPKIKGFGAVFLIVKFALFLLRERHRTDAIHIHMAKNLAAAAGLVRPWLRRPVLVKISGAWEFDGGVLDPRLHRNPLYATLRRLIQRNDGFQAISAETAKRLLDAGIPQEKVRLIPNAVDLALFSGAAGDAAPAVTRVIYVGRLTPVKGVDILLEAWRRLGAISDAELTIVGDGPQREELQAFVDTHGLTGTVRFSGWTNDVAATLRTANIYAQPSRSEGLPNSVLEAMAASLPIVASRVSGNEDLVVDGVNGYLVEPEDAQALANALQRLLSDANARVRMGRESRQRVSERYGADRIVALLEQAYSGA